MDLRDTPSQQLAAHIDWIRQRAAPDSPLSPSVWEELTLEMREHALFLEAFVLPKVEDPQAHLPTLHVIRGTGAGEALVHPQERVRVYESNGAEPEPEPVTP